MRVGCLIVATIAVFGKFGGHDHVVTASLREKWAARPPSLSPTKEKTASATSRGGGGVDPYIIAISDSNCTPSYPCPQCFGDCDTDDDCQGNLQCYQRDSGQEVPSCIGGKDSLSDADYCIDPGWEDATASPTIEEDNTLTEAETASPTEEGTASPTEEGTASPTEEGTASPTEEETASPTEEGTASPTEEETASPTEEEIASPTEEETASPTEEETASPTEEETALSTVEDMTRTEEETASPTEEETVSPTEEETASPTDEETASPTDEETASPTEEETALSTTEDMTRTDGEAASPIDIPELKDMGADYCTEASKCGLCEGDCDTNEDCEGDLVCYKRDVYENVPGCDGEDDFPTDYCIQPY